MAVQVSLSYQRLSLSDEGRHALAVAPVQHDVSEVGKRERGAGFVLELLVERDGLFEGGYRWSVVLLEEEDKAEPPERLGPDGGESPGVFLQRRSEPPFAFLETLPAPELTQRGHQPQPQLRALSLLVRLHRPRERPSQVPELGPKPLEPPALIGSQKLGFGALGESQVVLGVPAAHFRRHFALVQLFAPELPDRLEHPVAYRS